MTCAWKRACGKCVKLHPARHVGPRVNILSDPCSPHRCAASPAREMLNCFSPSYFDGRRPSILQKIRTLHQAAPPRIQHRSSTSVACGVRMSCPLRVSHERPDLGVPSAPRQQELLAGRRVRGHALHRDHGDRPRLHHNSLVRERDPPERRRDTGVQRMWG